MIRVFNLYIPSRMIVLLGGEAAIISMSFVLAVLIRFGDHSALIFSDQHGLWKILGITMLVLVSSHYMEMYDLHQLGSPGEAYLRILTLVGTLAFLLAGLTYMFPNLLLGRNVFLIGLCILALAWMFWRWAYGHLILLPALRERVYLLGNGERAKRIATAIRTREELGMDVAGWARETGNNSLTRESLGKILQDLGKKRAVDRVIVALTDRRSRLPVNELLELRLSGIQIEDGTSLLEKVSGQIEVDELHPSWMIFGDGFRLTGWHWLVRDLVSTVLALCLSILTLPLIPIIVILIKLSSPGPVLYRQKRVGLRDEVFNCYKFRTMRPDAEADSGPTWALDNDPRVTRVGRILRLTRLDEIPQLWNVIRGDMAFVGPRPERPEFIAQLSQEIPYYHLRHVVRPGITGWAQIRYKYGNSVKDAKEKLKYDLFYIKNKSLSLDLWILFQTVRTVLFGMGAL
ncbi:MAG: TIGR03013 family XrtA/PEP-CTERM system glycosyltransferase [Candidatus Acidiferrales bacterium]